MKIFLEVTKLALTRYTSRVLHKDLQEIDPEKQLKKTEKMTLLIFGKMPELVDKCVSMIQDDLKKETPRQLSTILSTINDLHSMFLDACPYTQTAGQECKKLKDLELFVRCEEMLNCIGAYFPVGYVFSSFEEYMLALR